MLMLGAQQREYYRKYETNTDAGETKTTKTKKMIEDSFTVAHNLTTLKKSIFNQEIVKDTLAETIRTAKNAAKHFKEVNESLDEKDKLLKESSETCRENLELFLATNGKTLKTLKKHYKVPMKM